MQGTEARHPSLKAHLVCLVSRKGISVPSQDAVTSFEAEMARAVERLEAVKEELHKPSRPQAVAEELQVASKPQQ